MSTTCLNLYLPTTISAESVTLLLGECTARLLDQKFLRSAGKTDEGATSSVVNLDQKLVDTMNRCVKGSHFRPNMVLVRPNIPTNYY